VVNFLLGVASSIVASLLILTLTNREDLRYFVSSRRRYKNLSGSWLQYHLSTDSALAPVPMWVTHEAQLRLTAFGHVKGDSASEVNENYQYAVTGSIRNGVMRLRLDNKTAAEEPAFMIFPNLLPADVIVGIWTGQDFDQQWTSGPVVFSRGQLDLAELSHYAEEQRNLGITRPVRHFVRYYPGELSSAWGSDVGKRMLERLPDIHASRMVIAGTAYEDGTGKLLFGPQERLPLAGRYKVAFHLVIKNLVLFDGSDKLVRLDVYGNDRALAKRFIEAAGLRSQYSWYELSFDYLDLTLKLEYRIALLKKDLQAAIYDVTVEKIGDIHQIYPSSNVPVANGDEA
jgi:hypothetical protein